MYQDNQASNRSQRFQAFSESEPVLRKKFRPDSHQQDSSGLAMQNSRNNIRGNSLRTNSQNFIAFDNKSQQAPIVKEENLQQGQIKIEDNKGPKRQDAERVQYSFNDPICPGQEILPVHEEMDNIMGTINKHQVIVISGNTGCGKSTQIPKFIACSDPYSKIIVTQPRRVAAIALAQRVSEELQSPLGQRVGYHIGQESMQRKTTQIVYVTIGIFLQKLVNDPEQFMSEYTHIILDEVHERGIESDFGLIALKTFLSQSHNRTTIKLIIMSATLNKDIFLNYFSTSELDKLEKDIKEGQNSLEYFFDSSKFQKSFVSVSGQNNSNNQWNQGQNANQAWVDLDNYDEAYEQMKQMTCKYNYKYTSAMNNFVEIEIKQKYKVHTIWLDHIDQAFKFCNKNYFNARKPELHDELYRLAAKEIKRVLYREVEMLNRMSDKGDILVFVPGYAEIAKLRQILEETITQFKNQNPEMFYKHPFKIMELHSSLGDINTKELLGLQSYTKVILATNIAESSITIPNCFVVMDFCLTKEINYNPSNGIERLELSWASKASITQRAGRTGRNCNGVNLRLIPQKFFEAEIRDYQIPEILRCPIEKVILKIKILDEGESEYDYVHLTEDCEQNDLIEEIIREKEDGLDVKKKKNNYLAITKDEKKNRIDIDIEDNKKEEKNESKRNNNQNNTTNSVRMFEDPVRVLSRAIESPDDFSICASMENLISIGALKLKKVRYANELNEKIKVRVTRLGRFYNEIPCDIKLGKFICFGYFFDCLVDAITIASIFSQRKSFFIPFMRIAQDINSIDRFTDMIFNFDSGQESDMILQLKIFREWENIFFRPFLDQKRITVGPSIVREQVLKYEENEINNEDNEELISHEDENLSLADKIAKMKEKILTKKSSGNTKNLAFEAKTLENKFAQIKDQLQGQVLTSAPIKAELINRRTLLEFRKRRISHEEHFWCQEHFCDAKVLREVLSTREDFKLRIPKEAGNIEDLFSQKNLDDEDHITKIKFCLAGAFNKYTLRSDIYDVKEMQKIRNYLAVEQMDAYRTIIIENTIYSFQNISPEEKEAVASKLKQCTNEFCRERIRTLCVSSKITKDFVEKVVLKYSSIYIEFIESPLLHVFLKEIMTMKRRFFNHTKLMKKEGKTIEIPGTAILKLRELDFNDVFIKGQNTFKYAYEAKLNLSNEKLNKIVSLESDSINFVTLGDFNRHKYLVASELTCRGNRVVAQGITVMPHNQPLFLALAALVFGSQCFVNCDKEGKKYESVNVDNVQIEIDHYLLDIDINEVNVIRKELRTCLDEDSFFNGSANLHLDLWNKVRHKLLSRITMRQVDAEKWESLYSMEYQQGRFEVNAEMQKKIKVQKILGSLRTNDNPLPNSQMEVEETSNNAENQTLSKKPKRSVKLLFQNKRRKNNQEKTTYASEKGFMNQIILTKASEQSQVTLSDQGNIDLLQEYFEGYNLWKQKKIRELKQFFLLHTIDDPTITCRHCLEDLWFQVPLFKASKLRPVLERVHEINFNGFTDNLYIKELNFIKGNIVDQNPLDKGEKRRIFTQNQEFIRTLDNLLNPFKFLEGQITSGSSVDIGTLKFYACPNGHLLSFTNEENQLYNKMKIPDCGQLLLLYQDLEYVEFKDKLFAEFEGEFDPENIADRIEKKATMLSRLPRLDCIVCSQIMSESEKLEEELKQQDQGVDTKNWSQKLEKHLKSEPHKLNEEAFLKSTRSLNYFFTSQ